MRLETKVGVKKKSKFELCYHGKSSHDSGGLTQQKTALVFVSFFILDLVSPLTGALFLLGLATEIMGTLVDNNWTFRVTLTMFLFPS